MILSVINQKGGVGKTTTAINLAVSLAQWGHSTLLVDLDPQGNATSGVGLLQQPSPTLYEALVAQVELQAEDDEDDDADAPPEKPLLLAALTGPASRVADDSSAADDASRTDDADTADYAAATDHAVAMARAVAKEEAAAAATGVSAKGATESPTARPNGGYAGPIPAIAPGPVPNLWIIGASPELAGSEVELAGNPRRDGLRQLLQQLQGQYSFIVIDTPPSLSLLTVNSLVAADQLIIPVQCEYFALEGLGQLLRTLEKIKRYLNPNLRVMGLLRTMFDPRVSLSSLVSQELEQHFPQLLFKTVIPRNVRLAEAPSFGKPIALHDKRSAGADAYRRLAREVLERDGKAPTYGA